MTSVKMILAKILFVCVIVCVHTAPTPMTKDDAMSYLDKYGYMLNKTEENFDSAMKMFQKFMGLSETGLMDAATEKMMNLPRCGMPDIKPSALKKRTQRFAVHGSRWRRSEMTYRIVKYSDKIESNIVDQELQAAFDIWAKYLNITFRPNTTRADLEIGFYTYAHGHDLVFDGEGNSYGHAFYPIKGGGIHFDDSENWTFQSDDGINFKQVAIHEIGHSLGMRHSNILRSIMLPVYIAYIPNIELDTDDITGIQTLYSKTYTN